MNEFLLSVVGLLTIFLAGFLIYGFVAKEYIDTNSVPLTAARFVIAAIGMYVISYSYITLFNNISLGESTGIVKGIKLSLLIAVPFTVIPLFADAPYLRGNKPGMDWVVISNWVLAIVALGVVVGALV